MKLRLTGADVLRPDGFRQEPVSIADGRISENDGREVDLSGFLILPGIIDMHGDGFERHLAPRRGAMKDLSVGLRSCDAELAANGITTAVLAQFWSWEGGMRGPDFARAFLEALARTRMLTDIRVQLRLETHLIDDYAAFEDAVTTHEVPYVVFNDHLPHAALSKGKKPPRLTGQALKSGRSPEAHLALLQALHGVGDQVPEAVAGLAARLLARGVRLGSHDDQSAADRDMWRARGVVISEFPETQEAAAAASAAGDPVILGAPNVVRGGSHKQNVSARDLIGQGIGDALASDYHYPTLIQAAFLLADEGVCDLAQAWRLVSKGPAAILGLDDRGQIVPGKRADLVVIDPETRRAGATITGGEITHMSGEVARRFLTG
ncbi:alpha-D-ribose 1-methylphosphonate 5-triphosphate diphosphatase [Shimia biformata]|uniref:alpha-D-ribose 1-methylphosphonate 5-triphosphate diphosphatase n=1 Tax=Shimia biformata TaxID=1294299 RepID=UPI00194E0088|nr:alpha-D-ribose 1-methylphosphonate 5-triphosphate diphosphatase [Shimia biformata]